VDRYPEAAIDATGMEARHTSRHYVLRAGYERFLRRQWPKVTLVCHNLTHLIAGMVVCHGPSQDSPQLPAAIQQACTHLPLRRLLADAGYDGEHNHRLCREQFGIKHTVIALNKRNTGRKWPQTRYRREMKTSFDKTRYRQRWQAESLFSRWKRNLGSALYARNDDSQLRECELRGLTHNLMLLA
jgi:Transposase DDE domain